MKNSFFFSTQILANRREPRTNYLCIAVDFVVGLFSQLQFAGDIYESNQSYSICACFVKVLTLRTACVVND